MRTWPTESTKELSYGFTETEAVITNPALVCTRSSAYRLCLLAWWFHEISNSGKMCVSDSFVCYWDCFSPTGFSCPASIWGFLPYLIVTWFFFWVWLLSLGGLIFSEKKQRVWSALSGEKMWWRQGVKTGESVVDIHFMRLEFLFKEKIIRMDKIWNDILIFKKRK